MPPKYSICMINLNMDNTIKESVSSIASQLDENYELRRIMERELDIISQ